MSHPAQSEHPRSLQEGLVLPFLRPQSFISSSFAHLMPSFRISLFRLISVSGNLPFLRKMMLKQSPNMLSPTNISAAMKTSILPVSDDEVRADRLVVVYLVYDAGKHIRYGKDRDLALVLVLVRRQRYRVGHYHFLEGGVRYPFVGVA